jgi:Txe/YoeB family toxin of Txe-Axe toxin-antitoxin module
MNLPILIRDEVWEYLQSTDLRSAKEVQQCIKKVEKGQFDFGLRVKKLKGVSQRVWEARINQASRLLFTYRSFKSGDGQVQTYRAIESICVEHDDVNHQARVIGRNWEGLEIVEILGNLDLESDQLNSKEPENIYLWEREEIEIQVELTDELIENIKWLILKPEIIESEEEWQNAVESGANLRLLLTSQENELINTYGNILISGSAGTGKTTVGLYRLARTLQMNPSAMCLYVAYNPILVKESEEQFKRLWGSSYENIPLKPSFLTIRDLCLKITKDFGKEFNHHLVDYPQFHLRYIKKPESREYPPSLIWDEIRSVIKGTNLNKQSQSSLLSEKEYESLGKKRSGIIQQKERHDVYKLAQWYQQYLDREKLADEIDLTRAALHIANIEKYEPYTLVVCDEVQDFTEIQLEFLLRLITKGGQVLCAGDINQMISPSGFRWGDLTTRLYEKNRGCTKKNLSVNFRSTGKLISLAIKILNLKFKLLAESQSPEKVPQSITGELARLVEASTENLKGINLGASDAILVRTEKRKQELNKSLETVLIFTIEESKGLEFDTVYLIDFFEHSKNLWTTALSSSKKLKEQEKPELRLEFNLLYVAITRARRLLNICEAERSDLWKHSELTENLIPMSVDEAFNQAQSIGSQDWYNSAIYYRNARLLAQALECATKSGDETLTQEIKVEFLLLKQKYDEAAQLLLEIKKYSEAAEILETLADWKEAAQAWNEAGNRIKSLECKVRYLKDKNQLEDAANILIELARFKEAAEILESGKYWDKAAELWDKLGNKEHQERCLFQLLIVNEKYQEVADIFEKELKWEKACEFWFKAGNSTKATACEAHSLESKGEWELAAEKWDSIRMDKQSAFCRDKVEKINQKNNYFCMIDSFTNIVDFLDYAKDKEKKIARAILRKYGKTYIADSELIDLCHYMNNAIQLKTQGLYNQSIDKYSMFFSQSEVGKNWYMTYYGIAKVLTLATEYDRALSAILIAIELCSIAKCPDVNYMREYHYKNILRLKEGGECPSYLSSIREFNKIIDPMPSPGRVTMRREQRDFSQFCVSP